MGSEKMRIKTSITLEKELLEWMDEKIKIGVYASRSHAIRFALMQLMKVNKTKG
ncbi:unnamed protein product [marine sediment metagenome]|uniref:Uncharacterized protein n=1 Tax=marine sediment metagenome TaxID=412755 RepID=X1JD63_9ZZZZ